MSGYRERKSLKELIWPPDRWTLPYIAARTGFGLVAIGIGIMLTGGSVIPSAITAIIGAMLLTYGLRN